MIFGGWVVDFVSGMDVVGDVVVLDGRIVVVGMGFGGVEWVIDVIGFVVVFGFIDLYVYG